MKTFALFLLAAVCAGCVINFHNETAPKKGIIHVDVQYLYPGKNELKTIAGEGTYKKEIEKGHYAETKIALDPGQQLLVLNKALVLHFFEWPENFTHKGSEDAGAVPQSLHIHADSLDRTIHWSGSTDGLRPDKYHPKELIEYIDSIVKSTDDYQGLPEVKSSLN